MSLVLSKLKPIKPMMKNYLNQVLGSTWEFEQKLQDVWLSIVGSEFAQNVKIDCIKNDHLILKCFHSVWLMEVKFQKEAIKLQINQANLGFQIRSIIMESSW